MTFTEAQLQGVLASLLEAYIRETATPIVGGDDPRGAATIEQIRHAMSGATAWAPHGTLSSVQALGARVDLLQEQVAELLSVRPREQAAFLNSLCSDALTLRRPIGIVLEFHEDSTVIARWTEALLEGEGTDPLTAIEELRSQIVTAHDDLRDIQAEGARLAEYPAALWQLLQEFLQSS